MKAVRSMVLVSSDPQSMAQGAEDVYKRLEQELIGFGLETKKFLFAWLAMLAGTMRSQWSSFIPKRSFTDR